MLPARPPVRSEPGEIYSRSATSISRRGGALPQAPGLSESSIHSVHSSSASSKKLNMSHRHLAGEMLEPYKARSRSRAFHWLR